VSKDFSVRVVGLRRLVTLCKTAPYRNSLTYLLTYLLTYNRKIRQSYVKLQRHIITVRTGVGWIIIQRLVRLPVLYDLMIHIIQYARAKPCCHLACVLVFLVLSYVATCIS